MPADPPASVAAAEPLPARCDRRPVVALLTELALGREHGTVLLPDTGEEIVVRDGRIVLVETPRSPSPHDLLIGSGRLDATAWSEHRRRDGGASAPSGVPVFTWERMCRESTADAAVAVLDSDSDNLDFRQGMVPAWTGLVPATPIAELLREVTRRAALLRRAGHAVTPRSTIGKTHGGGWPRLQVSRGQWRLLAAVQIGATPSSIAPRIGQGVTATTMMSYQLWRWGLLSVERSDDHDAQGPAPQSLFLG